MSFRAVSPVPKGSERAHQATEADASLRLGHRAEPAEGMTMGASFRMVLVWEPGTSFSSGEDRDWDEEWAGQRKGHGGLGKGQV
jgi:hypothetical protein